MLQVHAPCPTGNNNNNNDTSAASVIITMKMQNGYVQRHRSIKCRVQNLSSSENVNINEPSLSTSRHFVLAGMIPYTGCAEIADTQLS